MMNEIEAVPLWQIVVALAIGFVAGNVSMLVVIGWRNAKAFWSWFVVGRGA